MLKESPKLLHWNYFLVLESDLEQLSRYIEFTEVFPVNTIRATHDIF